MKKLIYKFLKLAPFFLIFNLLFEIQYSNAQYGWNLQSNPLGNGIGLGKIQFVSSTEGWISAGQGKLLHTTNAGANWMVVMPFPSDTVNSMSDPSITMWWANQTHGWKINWLGTNFYDCHGAVIHQTTNGGATWQKKVISTNAGDIGLQIQFADASTGWISIVNFTSGLARSMKSSDGGSNWFAINTTSTDLGIFHYIDALNGWSVSGGPNQAPPYKISHTTNGGLNWSVQYTDNTQGGLSRIQFTDVNNGWVVGDDGKILKSANGGVNWTQITNAGISSTSHNKSLYFLNANTGWITNDGQNWQELYTILRTTNGGVSWTQENPNFTNGSMFNIFFWDANNGWFSGERCVQNCNGPDSLMIFTGLIGYTSSGGIGIRQISSEVPTAYSLKQNYPNPFNPNTVINFQLPKNNFVTLKIYDILGREVATLVNEQLKPGAYRVDWDASNYSSGMYFYKLSTDNFSETKRMALVK